MRKQLIGKGTLCVLMLAIAAMVCSCQKEQLTKGTFTATMEGYSGQGDKVVFSNMQFHWMQNDTIAVTRTDGTNYAMGLYFASEVSQNNTATLSYFSADGNTDVTGESFRGDYYAFSPNRIYDSPNSVTLPTTYSTDADGNLIGFPMYAKSSSTLLKFKNLCGMVRLRVHTPGTITYIRKITLTTNQKVNGTFSVSGENTPTLSYTGTPTEEQKSVTLKTLVDISTSHDFFIPLPERSYSSLIIKLYTADGKTCTLAMGEENTLEIVRSQYTVIDLTPTETFSLNFTRATGAKGGFFSVSSTQKVQFSQGNLQYRAMDENNALHHWRFAENQYDHIFKSDLNYNNSYETILNTYYKSNSREWLDLFMWGTSGYSDKDPYRLDYLVTNYNNNYPYWYNPQPPAIANISGTNYDWGVNCSISNGGDAANLWRTLTKGEWEYLFNTRADASKKWARATITNTNNSTKGLILLPDDWEYPSDVTPLTCGNNSHFSSNQITSSSTWQKLEALGAIFLPLTGYLYRTPWKINQTQIRGFYWTSSFSHKQIDNNNNSIETTFAFYLSFMDGDCSFPSALWHRGFAVRLVRDAGSDEL